MISRHAMLVPSTMNTLGPRQDHRFSEAARWDEEGAHKCRGLQSSSVAQTLMFIV